MSLPRSLARAAASRMARVPPRRWAADGPAARPIRRTGQHFLINVSAGIGDALMALPMIRVLRDAYPDGRIELLATPVNAALLAPEPGVDGVIRWPVTPTPPALASLAWRLRRAHFDAVLCTIPSELISTSLAVWLAGIPMRVKHWRDQPEPARDWQFCFTDLVASRPHVHKVMENLSLLAPAGVGNLPRSPGELARRMRLTVTDAERSRVLPALPRSSRAVRIGMHPGCKAGWEFKRWDPARFATLAAVLARRHNAEIIWFGGADEAPLVNSIMAAAGIPSVSVAGTLGVREAAVLMSSCSAFVSNDSGPMHMATAAGVPTIGLYSSSNPRTDPARTGPFGPGHVVIAKPDLGDIETEEVAAAVAGLLARQPGDGEAGPR